MLPETGTIAVCVVPAINVQKGNPHNIRGLKDLLKPGLRVAIANPEGVCVGAYAVEIFEKELTPAEREQLEVNIRNHTGSCEQTATAIPREPADAVIGWRVFQYWAPERIETIPLPKERIPRIGHIPIAISKYSRNPGLAQQFIDFVNSPKGRAIYARYSHFTGPEAAFKWTGMPEIAGLCAQAGGFHLQDITLMVGKGECHAVPGPSGSGKSRLPNAILGTVPLNAGTLRLSSEDLGRLPVERRRLGHVPQHLGLFPHLSVRDNLLHITRARRVPAAEYQPALDRLVEITGIGALLSRRIATLSGGERQRVALVADPRLVLLDEPFTALNESLRREHWWLLKALQRERGLTVLLVTHDLTGAYVLADHITVLIDGRQEQSGDKQVVFNRPASLAVARFLGLKNLFSASVREAAGGHIVAACPALGLELRLPGEAPGGGAIVLGLRQEAVALRDSEHPPRPGEHLVRGTVRLVDLGGDVAIHLHPEGGGPVIEAMASRRVVKRFGLHDGQGGVGVALPQDRMFWVKA